MSKFTRRLLCAAAATVLAFALAAGHTGPAARAVPDFTVFFDPPTGFVFVKLPAGWAFVGRVEAQDVARLPPTVVTSLLDDEPGADGNPVAAAR